MRNLFLLVAVLAASCTSGDDDPGLPDAVTAPDAAPPDAVPVPRCADVGCSAVAFCNVNGCCSCNATGAPVQCLGPTAPPDACELP